MKQNILEKLVKLSQNENIPEELVDVLAYLCDKKMKKDAFKAAEYNYSSVKSFILSYKVKISDKNVISKHDVYSLYELFCVKFNVKPLVNSIFWPALEKELYSMEEKIVNLKGIIKSRCGVRQRYVSLTLEGV